MFTKYLRRAFLPITFAWDSLSCDCIFRSPSDVDTLGRASVLRDGAAFRPASAPHPLLLESHFYQPFAHPSETPLHPHTAPHTPTEMEQQLERARSEEHSNCEVKEGVAEGEEKRQTDLFERDQCKNRIKRDGFSSENLCSAADLRIKQEPIASERVDKLTERLSEAYSGRGFDASSYGSNSDHLPHGAQLGSAIVAPMVPAHPPTPDQKPATPALWNTKISKASTVATIDGEYHLLSFCVIARDRCYLVCTWRAAQIANLI